MEMSAAAKAAKAEYDRKWKQEHREQYLETKRAWAKANPEKIRAYNSRYWERKAAKLAEQQD